MQFLLTMAKAYREVSKLLAISEESFEDEVRRLVSNILLLYLMLNLILTKMFHERHLRK